LDAGVPISTLGVGVPNADDSEEAVMRQLAAEQRQRLLQLAGGLSGVGVVMLGLYFWCCRRRPEIEDEEDDFEGGIDYSGMRAPAAAGGGAGWGGWGWGGGAAREGNELLVPACCALDISDNASQAGSTISQEQMENWDDFDLDEEEENWGTPSRAANEDGIETDGPHTNPRQHLLI
jgi:hypothetical protein